MATHKKQANRFKRKWRVRRKVYGTESIPRLSVFRSNRHIYAQIIDDSKGITLVAASSKALKLPNGSNKEAAIEVGKDLANKAKSKKISKVVFDRNGNLYHGRIKELADAARSEGLNF